MEHKEILALALAVIAVSVVIALAKMVRGSSGEESSLPELPAVSASVPAETTVDFWDKIRQENAQQSGAETQPADEPGQSPETTQTVSTMVQIPIESDPGFYLTSTEATELPQPGLSGNGTDFTFPSFTQGGEITSVTSTTETSAEPPQSSAFVIHVG